MARELGGHMALHALCSRDRPALGPMRHLAHDRTHPHQHPQSHPPTPTPSIAPTHTNTLKPHPGIWPLICVRILLHRWQCSGFELEATNDSTDPHVGGVGVSFCLLLDGHVIPLVGEGIVWEDHLPNAREIANAAEGVGGRVLGFFDDDES